MSLLLPNPNPNPTPPSTGARIGATGFNNCRNMAPSSGESCYTDRREGRGDPSAGCTREGVGLLAAVLIKTLVLSRFAVSQGFGRRAEISGGERDRTRRKKGGRGLLCSIRRSREAGLSLFASLARSTMRQIFTDCVTD